MICVFCIVIYNTFEPLIPGLVLILATLSIHLKF